MYPEHLLHAVNSGAPDQSKRAITSLTKFVNLASRGQLPEFVAPILCSATLTALKKLKGGVRPIAVGEVIRRLIAKCIAREANSEAADLFNTKQLGVAVKGGAEGIVHATRVSFEKLQKSKNSRILQIDFKNAFNSVKRSKVLEAVAKFLPSVAPFATFCYSQHSHLHFNNTYLSSQSGVQQGDPLGPLLFSLALWPIIKEVETKIPNLVQHNWYLDDGILAGTHRQLCTALHFLTNLCEGCGLELRIEKCELWSPVNLNAIDTRVKRNSKEGLEILGAAIGNHSFVAASLRKRVNKIEKLLENLAYLDDPYCALGILRSCLGAPKMVYSLRCNTPSEESSVILQDFDNLQRTTFENMLGTVISDSAWKQACLPINKTGVGIRQAVDQLKAVFVGSVSQAEALVEQITGEKITDNQIFKETVEELQNLEISQYTQHKIQEALDDAAFSDLLGNQISNREKARLLSLTLPQSGAWLSAPPIPSLGLHLQPNEFRAALKYRIGVPLYIEERKCPYCQNGRLDKLGDHALSCHGRGDVISRHDRVRDRIFAACSTANLSPDCEQKNFDSR